MYCNQCGKPNVENAVICMSCGAKFNNSCGDNIPNEIESFNSEPTDELQNDYMPVQKLRHRSPIQKFFLEKGNKRYLVMTLIGFFCLSLAGLGKLFAFFFLTMGILFGLYTYYASIEMIVLTAKSKSEIENIIRKFFSSKQKWSSRKWNEVNGPGYINMEIKVSELPLPAEFDTSGKAVISIDIFDDDSERNEVDIWTSQWTILRWIIPRGLSKTKRAIKQLASQL